MGFKLMAGAVASCALIGVAVGVGIIYGSLLISIGRNPSQRDELLRYAFIGFSLVEVSGLIGLVISLLLLFGFDRIGRYNYEGKGISLLIQIEITEFQLLHYRACWLFMWLR